jgi:hypothetical protein
MVSREEVAEMEKFKAIIEGFGSVSIPINESGHSTSNAIQTSNGPDKDMKRFVQIMNNVDMNKVTNAAKVATKQLLTEAAFNPELAEALETTPTEDGVKIGKWRIRAKLSESKKRKYFDVFHSTTNQTIAKNLFIYEAALALVRLLNKGKPINSPEIKQVLALEEQYASARTKALQYKITSLRALKENNVVKSEIYENRYDVIVAKALLLEENIRDISNIAL